MIRYNIVTWTFVKECHEQLKHRYIKSYKKWHNQLQQNDMSSYDRVKWTVTADFHEHLQQSDMNVCNRGTWTVTTQWLEKPATCPALSKCAKEPACVLLQLRGMGRGRCCTVLERLVFFKIYPLTFNLQYFVICLSMKQEKFNFMYESQLNIHGRSNWNIKWSMIVLIWFQVVLDRANLIAEEEERQEEEFYLQLAQLVVVAFLLVTM